MREKLSGLPSEHKIYPRLFSICMTASPHLASLMRILLLLIAMSLSLPANPLDKYLWKNRILIVQSKGQNQALNQLLLKNQEALADRDLIVINLTTEKIKLANQIRPTREERTALLNKFKLSKAEQPTFVLIGKDGGEKSRQTQTLDLEKIFALIDTMPMRKNEMKKK